MGAMPTTRSLVLLAFVGACTSNPPAGETEGSSGSVDSSGTAGSATSPTSTMGVDSSTGGPGTLTTTGSETSVATDPASSSGGSACATSQECGDPANPICSGGACGPCQDDQQCTDRDPVAPACRDDGACVQCTADNDSQCEGSTPWCDEVASACAACSFHEQCPDSACRIATGGCFDEAEVYRVGPGQDFVDLATAVEALGDGEHVLRLAADVAGNYSTTITGAGAVYAIVADDPTTPPYLGFGGATTLRAEAGAEVYVQDALFAVIIGSQPMVVADDASIYFDRVRVLSFAHGGVSLQNGAYALVRTSTLTQLDSPYPALAVSDSNVDVLYSTFAAYTNAGTAALSCTGPATATIRNSIVLSEGAGPDVSCDGATVTYSATNALQRGTGNVMLGMFDDAWFASYNNGDLALTSAAPDELLTTAQWKYGDPVTDLSGDLRPTVDGTADVAGADIP